LLLSLEVLGNPMKPVAMFAAQLRMLVMLSRRF
jgi:hypothetical protein